jgi:hypothetical protein
VKISPHGFTVLQTLYEREHDKAFNQDAASEFPTIRQEFDAAIRDFVVAREGRTPSRRIRTIAKNAWKSDPAADRRIRKMEKRSPKQFRSPYRGQPERYDPEVVLAFADAVARASGRPRVSWTRGTTDNKSTGAILDTLIAAIQWAMCEGWRCFGPPDSKPPKVKAEGVLGIIKAKRTRSTD